MNALQLLGLVKRYRPVVGLAGLLLYHVANGSNPKQIVADLEAAAREFGVPIPEVLESLLPLLALAAVVDPPASATA